MTNAKQSNSRRLHLAQIAAQLMQEQGIRDFRVAKEKAALRLGVDVRRTPLPRNTEIEAALAEQQRLFGDADAEAHLHRLRAAALEAMQLFAEFRPRLVGDVLSGLATDHSDVQLHLFADHSEAFDLLLQQHGIPYEMTERRFRYGRGEYRYNPAFRFAAGGIGFEAVIFAAGDIRRAPDSVIDGAPMARAKREAVARLLPAASDA